MKATWWVIAGAAAAVALAWAATDGATQAKVSAHVGNLARVGADLTVPGTQAPIKTGTTVGQWAPHHPDGGKVTRRHPRGASPCMTLLQARGHDWLFCPPSEGDL